MRDGGRLARMVQLSNLCVGHSKVSVPGAHTARTEFHVSFTCCSLWLHVGNPPQQLKPAPPRPHRREWHRAGHGCGHT